MPEPHFALAHSMGGAIALNAAYESWLPFRRLVTTTPMIALRIIKRYAASAVCGADPALARDRRHVRARRRRDVDLHHARSRAIG